MKKTLKFLWKALKFLIVLPFTILATILTFIGILLFGIAYVIKDYNTAKLLVTEAYKKMKAPKV